MVLGNPMPDLLKAPALPHQPSSPNGAGSETPLGASHAARTLDAVMQRNECVGLLDDPNPNAIANLRRAETSHPFGHSAAEDLSTGVWW